MVRKKTKLLKNYTLDELLEELDKTVRWWHYDPHNEPKPKYTIDEIKKEILNRFDQRREVVVVPHDLKEK